jgi:hypothetical protein
MKTCETCRLSGPGNVHGYTNALACHLQPPFPIVRNQDWCSHWATKEDGAGDTERMIQRAKQRMLFLKHEREELCKIVMRNNCFDKIGQEMWL